MFAFGILAGVPVKKATPSRLKKDDEGIDLDNAGATANTDLILCYRVGR